MQKILLTSTNQDDVVRFAAPFFQNENVILYPAETMYGLGCDIYQTRALERILQLKSRDAQKGFIVLIHSLAQLQDIADVDESLLQRLQNIWPAHLTCILPAKPHIQGLLTGFQPTVAVRMPQHAFLRNLLAHLEHPIVSTSANISQQAPLRDEKEMEKYWKNSLDLFIMTTAFQEHDMIPSTIVQLCGSKAIILREGSISYHELQQRGLL